MAESVAKVTISLPVDLLGEIDDLAALTGASRSFVIREASVGYLTTRRDADSAAARRRGVDCAIAQMREIGSRPVRDDRPSLEILHELRDSDAPSSSGPDSAQNQSEGSPTA